MSAGYFSGMQKAILAHPNLGFCRRWTGGGIVVHEADFTFGLIVPRGENLAAVRAGESYRRIHLALAEALRRHGIEADLSPEGTTMAAECFAGAVEHDLMRHGAKIAGGAQRRTRNGLLHQGSIQGLPGLERGFGETLAQILADSIGVWTPPPDFERGVEALAEGKYATPGFLRGPRAANDFTAEPAS